MTTNTQSLVIGEGAYGCIHKPSLTCKETIIKNYKNKVSKVLEKEYANMELKEYDAIINVDKTNEYNLGKPIECSINNIPRNISAIKKCKMGKDLLKHLDDLSLLVMEDGGTNLKEYSEIMGKWRATYENAEKAENFMIEFHNMFRGIHAFNEKNILHFDMKPHNIVYSEEKQKMNIIDFGLSVSLKEKLEDIDKNTNTMAIYHWSYPFEFHFLNKRTYEKFAKMTETEKHAYYKYVVDELATNKDSNTTMAMKSFFTFILDKDTDTQEFKDYMSGFYQTILSELTMQNYKNFANKSISSVDVYGLGITLLYILKNTKHLLKDKLHSDLCDLGYSMIHSQLSKRITSGSALANYETILTNNGLTEKHGVSFSNHKIIKGVSIPKQIEQSIDSINVKNIILDDATLEKNAVSVSPLEKSKKYFSKSKSLKKQQKKRKSRSKKNSKSK